MGLEKNHEEERVVNWWLLTTSLGVSKQLRLLLDDDASERPITLTIDSSGTFVFRPAPSGYDWDGLTTRIPNREPTDICRAASGFCLLGPCQCAKSIPSKYSFYGGLLPKRGDPSPGYLKPNFRVVIGPSV